MKIMVIGGGKLIYFLSRSFTEKGHQVTVINRDREECTWLARHLQATVVYGDGSDPQVLEEAGAAASDVVLAVTPNDEDNLVICQLAQLRFAVPQTLALVNDPDHEQTFRHLGVTAVSTTRILSNLIEQRVAFEEITELMPIGEGQVNVTEVELGEDAPVVGKALHQVDLPENSLIACVLREGTALVPRGATQLRARDRLILITLPSNHSQVMQRVLGESNV